MRTKKRRREEKGEEMRSGGEGRRGEEEGRGRGRGGRRYLKEIETVFDFLDALQGNVIEDELRKEELRKSIL